MKSLSQLFKGAKAPKPQPEEIEMADMPVFRVDLLGSSRFNIQSLDLSDFIGRSLNLSSFAYELLAIKSIFFSISLICKVHQQFEQQSEREKERPITRVWEKPITLKDQCAQQIAAVQIKTGKMIDGYENLPLELIADIEQLLSQFADRKEHEKLMADSLAALTREINDEPYYILDISSYIRAPSSILVSREFSPETTLIGTEIREGFYNMLRNNNERPIFNFPPNTFNREPHVFVPRPDVFNNAHRVFVPRPDDSFSEFLSLPPPPPPLLIEDVRIS